MRPARIACTALAFSALLALAARHAPAEEVAKNAVTISGTIKVWQDGKERAGAAVRVVIGKDLQYKTGQSGTDTASAKPAYQTLTDDKGKFTLKVPAAGEYGILLWKAGFTPQIGTVTAPDAAYAGSISKDNQVGSSGRHRELKVSGAER